MSGLHKRREQPLKRFLRYLGSCDVTTPILKVAVLAVGSAHRDLVPQETRKHFILGAWLPVPRDASPLECSGHNTRFRPVVASDATQAMDAFSLQAIKVVAAAERAEHPLQDRVAGRASRA